MVGKLFAGHSSFEWMLAIFHGIVACQVGTCHQWLLGADLQSITASTLHVPAKGTQHSTNGDCACARQDAMVPLTPPSQFVHVGERDAFHAGTTTCCIL
jgi:hypothetical protein